MDPLTTILSVPAVLAIVQLLKDIGLPAKFGLLAALVVPVTLQVLSLQFGGSDLFERIISGLLIGLAAAGVFDAAKTASSVVNK